MVQVDLNNLLDAAADLAPWVGIRRVEEDTNFRIARDGTPFDNFTQFDHGLMVEVCHEGHYAYGATNDMTVEGVREATKRALDLAKLSSNWSLYKFDPSVRPTAVGEYRSAFKEEVTPQMAGEISRLLIDCSLRSKVSDKIFDICVYISFLLLIIRK